MSDAFANVCRCGCGKILPPRRKEKGRRYREYWGPSCRQRAWRERNKSKVNLRRSLRRLFAKYEDASQEARLFLPFAEWNGENQSLTEQLIRYKLLCIDQEREIQLLKSQVLQLDIQLLEQKGEVERLNILLDYHSRKKEP